MKPPRDARLAATSDVFEVERTTVILAQISYPNISLRLLQNVFLFFGVLIMRSRADDLALKAAKFFIDNPERSYVALPVENRLSIAAWRSLSMIVVHIVQVLSPERSDERFAARFFWRSTPHTISTTRVWLF